MFTLGSATIPSASQPHSLSSTDTAQPWNPIRCQWPTCPLATGGSSKQLLLAGTLTRLFLFCTVNVRTTLNKHSTILSITSNFACHSFYNCQKCCSERNKAVCTMEREQVTVKWLPARKRKGPSPDSQLQTNPVLLTAPWHKQDANIMEAT